MKCQTHHKQKNWNNTLNLETFQTENIISEIGERWVRKGLELSLGLWDSRVGTPLNAAGILTYLLTYSLHSAESFLEQLPGLQLVKKFPAFHGTRRFITALTSVRHLSLSWANPIQSIYLHPTSCRSIITLSTHLRLGLPSGLLPFGFPTKTLHTPLSPTHTRHMPSPSHSYRYRASIPVSKQMTLSTTVDEHWCLGTVSILYG